MKSNKNMTLKSFLQSDGFRRVMLIIGFLAPTLMTAPAFSASCRVLAVADDETLTVRCGTAPPSKVRLAEIGLPGLEQPFHQQARQRLAELVSGREVEVEVVHVDGSERVVAQVYRGYMHINAALVADGMAWCGGQYQRGHWCRAAEAGARIEQRGIWTDQQSVAPWKVRGQGGQRAARETAS